MESCRNSNYPAIFSVQMTVSSAAPACNILNMPFNPSNILEICNTVTFLDFSAILCQYGPEFDSRSPMCTNIKNLLDGKDLG
jgi:hypothetical protein